jgi:amino acid adenylation domain-containing protein
MKTIIASPVQLQFYLSSQLYPTPALNTMTYAIRIQGPLAPVRLARAIHRIGLRHPAMRTRLQTIAGAVVQVVDDEGTATPLEIIEAPAGEAWLAGAADLTRQAISPDNTAWNARLFRHGPDDHTLLLAAHRCIWDERSTTIFAAELSALYLADDNSTDGRLPPAASGGARRAHEALSEERAAVLAMTVAKGLADVPPTHGFPLKISRPKSLAVDTASTELAFPPSLQTLLVASAARLAVDPFLLEVAAAAYVLAQYGGQQKIALGLPVDLRDGALNGDAIGCYTAMVPVAIDCSASTFAVLVESLGESYRAAQPFASVPFHAIVKASGTNVHPGANPLFQIACVAERPFGLVLPGCESTQLAVAAPPQQLDLFLQFTSSSLRLGYATTLIASEMATSFVQSFVAFTETVLQNPTVSLSRLSVLSPEEQTAHALQVSATDRAASLEEDLYALVTRHGQSSGNKAAVIGDGRTLSYQELLLAIDDMAARLSDLELGMNHLVGICLPRSVDMVVAMLAVLRLGAAYVPLDPTFPRERLTHMVTHSQLTAIITTTKLRNLFEGHAVRFVDLDTGPGSSQGRPSPATRVPGLAKAYVIYTSGSTGKPKGVAIHREAVANFLLSMLERPGLSGNDVLAAITTLSFDIAALELLGPLCAGATVVIATEEEARDPRLLMDLMQRHGVTVLQATPVTWQMLSTAGLSNCKSLKALCGGEALSPSLARAVKPQVGELWNMYGPTETTIWSTCQRIDDVTAAISVGTPIHNTSVYVLDGDLRPVPAGVEARLFIGGAGVALGYLFDDELTAKRFLPDPFRGRGRMYDTGDRARRGRDGQLYLLGRDDFQVKIRGFRIELGEIEACLCGLPSIEAVVCHVSREEQSAPDLVGYYTVKPGFAAPSVSELRGHCSAVLPSHMIPSRFRRLGTIPRTPNGKVDRQALPRLGNEESPAQHNSAPLVPSSEAERVLLDIWCSVLAIPSASTSDTFFDLGGTSITAVSVAQEIARRFGLEISVLKIFEHPTIAALARFVQGSEAEVSVVRKVWEHAQERRKLTPSPTAFDVAIIGAAGRFPGARNLDQLWHNLCQGVESVTTFPRAALDPLVPLRDRNDPHYIPARGILEGVDLFDASFFNISPSEAELMDPQLRFFLETAWEAFENAGYVGGDIDGEVGVWAGMGNNFYYHHNVLTRPDKLAVMGEIAAEIANEKDHIAPRVSHKLNLRGPSLSVHTACSTTLVVVENAYQALVSHQVDVALAGGVDIRTPQRSGQRYEEGGVFSIDGHCRPFDAAATGTMFGEGVGAVVLKRLDDALRDNDTIYAVIKGAAVNHDGGNKVSYLAPSIAGQAKVVASALAIGDVNPDSVTFIEAHGTATPIGDPIEVEALTQVFRTFTQRRRFCAIGSIKGNFGHATTAAGIAGVLKVMLALRHQRIPPTLHFQSPNPRIDFASSPFFVNNRLIEWKPKNGPRRAGVSSFGFCGTNAHVVLEEAPLAPTSAAPSRPAQLILLSARSAPALDDLAQRWSKSLANASPSELADAAYTSHVGRKRFQFRRYVVVESTEALGDKLVQKAGARSETLKSDEAKPKVAFMFPGQGSQYIHMGSRLYQGETCFREAVDRCVVGLVPHLGCDLRDFLFPSQRDSERASESLNNTFYTQPAIFTISYAIALQMQHWGIGPSAFVGHSIGEFVAATLAGIMGLDDALRLVATRGRLMQKLPAGSMLTVRLPVETIIEQLPVGMDVAAINGPQLTVVAGPSPLVNGFADKLAADGIACRLLHTSHAFHSSMMDEMVEPFLQTVKTVPLSEPRIPLVSSVTGEWARPGELTDPGYWARHVRSTVQFSKAVQVLLAEPGQVLLECGPRRTCVALALQHRPKNPTRIIGTMPEGAEPADEHHDILAALGSLWLQGCDLSWSAYHQHEIRRRVGLPSYPFQRRRYWLDPGVAATGTAAPDAREVKTTPIGRPNTKTSDGVDGQPPPIAPSGDRFLETVRLLIEELLGSKVEAFDEEARFILLGLDSLMLTQLARTIRVRHGLEVTFRDLVERLSSPRRLADELRAKANVAPNLASDAAIPPAAHERQRTVPLVTPPAGRKPAADGISPASQDEAIPFARLGRDEQGQLAWYVPDLSRSGKFLKVSSHV